MVLQINSKRIINHSEEKSDFSVHMISVMLMLYIASIIVFRIKYYYISHILDLILLGIFVIFMLIKKLKIYKINNVVLLYFIFSVFSLVTSFWARDFNIAMMQSFQLFLISINMFMVYTLVRNYHIENFFIYGILLGAFVNFVFALGIFQSPFDIYGDSGRLIGTVGNSNALSVVMIISIFVSIIYLLREKEKENQNNKILYYYQYINIFLSLFLIVLTISKKGIISGFVLVLLFIWVSIKELKSFIRLGIASLVGFIIFINFVNFDDFWGIYAEIVHRFDLFEGGLSSNSHSGSTGIRLYFIELGWDLFRYHPIIGHGLNNFRLYSGGFYAHNNYIELLFDIGLVGFMIFYSIYIILFRKSLQVINTDFRFVFIFFLFTLLAMDMAGVSYVNKYVMYTLLFISILLENNVNFKGKNDAKKD